MKKVFCLLLAAVLACSMLAGCGSSGTTEQSSGVNNEELSGQNDAGVTDKPAESNGYIKDQIVVACTGVTSLTPWGTNNATPGVYEVYEALFECDSKAEMYPVLADANRGEFGGYDHEAGTGVYTVYIYDYIKDHNGNTVDADDVVFSFNHQKDSETTSGWGDLQSVEATDATTIVFTFADEQNNLGELANYWTRCFIVDEDSWKDSRSGLLSEMVGTGPYKMTDYVSASSLTIERNEDYWQTDESLRHQEQQANVQKIIYQFIDEAATRILNLKSGDIDISDDVASTDVTDFLDGAQYGDDYNVFTYMTKLISYLWCNCSEESICNDVNMRKAVFYAIDLDALVYLTGGTDTRGMTWATSYYSDYYTEWEQLDNYNTFAGDSDERSKIVQEYLDAAGYNGESLVFLYQNDMKDVATIVMNMLSNYGINTTAYGTDHTGASTLEADPTGWDMEFGKWAGDYNVQAWLHAYSWENTAELDHTVNYIYDQEWEDNLNLVQTEDGHTYENMTQWLETMYENGYGMNLFCGTNNIIYPSDITYICRNDKLTVLPGGCVYEEAE